MPARRQRLGECDERGFGAAERPRLGHPAVERDAVIGVIAWSLVPTLQRGSIGRITAIIVAEDVRRQGIGRALLNQAMADMAKAGARRIEAMSDIEIVNSHRFFRARDFEQTSYRFARPL